MDDSQEEVDDLVIAEDQEDYSQHTTTTCLRLPLLALLLLFGVLFAARSSPPEGPFAAHLVNLQSRAMHYHDDAPPQSQLDLFTAQTKDLTDKMQVMELLKELQRTQEYASHLTRRVMTMFPELKGAPASKPTESVPSASAHPAPPPAPQPHTQPLHHKPRAISGTNAQVGRDDHLLYLSYHCSDKRLSSGSQSQWNSKCSMRLELLDPLAECGRECLYRFYIEGPASMGGYLTPSDRGSLTIFVIELPVHESGFYGALVFLEWLGRGVNALDRLPERLSSSGSAAEHHTNETKFKSIFEGIVVSDPYVLLHVKLPDEPAFLYDSQLPACSYMPKSPVEPRGVRWVAQNRAALDQMKSPWEAKELPRKLKADNCEAPQWSVENVKKWANSVPGGIRVILGGTSRVEHLLGLSKDLLNGTFRGQSKNGHRPYTVTTPFNLTMEFIHMHGPAWKNLRDRLTEYGLCSGGVRYTGVVNGTDQFVPTFNSPPPGLTLFFLSFGLWEARYEGGSWHDLRNMTAIEFGAMMLRETYRVAHIVDSACASANNTAYHIVWMDDAPTHGFGSDLPGFHVPNISAPADVFVQHFFSGLGPATPMLQQGAHAFRRVAEDRKDAYIPFINLLMANNNGDHLHLWKKSDKIDMLTQVFSVVGEWVNAVT